jgi:hypothetical protein
LEGNHRRRRKERTKEGGEGRRRKERRRKEREGEGRRKKEKGGEGELIHQGTSTESATDKTGANISVLPRSPLLNPHRGS